MKKVAIILSALAAKYQNQSVTAYVAPAGSLTYYGTTPTMYVTAAVRPKTCGNALSGTKLPRGTIITTGPGLPFPDARIRTTFQVGDMGDVKCAKKCNFLLV
ncbi:MAG: hypothetical protein RR595_08735 [Lysinibacillus sp.]